MQPHFPTRPRSKAECAPALVLSAVSAPFASKEEGRRRLSCIGTKNNEIHERCQKRSCCFELESLPAFPRASPTRRDYRPLKPWIPNKVPRSRSTCCMKTQSKTNTNPLSSTRFLTLWVSRTSLHLVCVCAALPLTKSVVVTSDMK